jgi:arginase
MEIRLITTESVAGTAGSPDPERAAGLAGAAAAFLHAGIVERLADAGATVDQVVSVSAPRKGTPDDPIAALAGINAGVGRAVAAALRQDVAPVLVGGNCSHTIGMIAGIQAAYGPTTRLGLLWLDAHGDFNTPRTSLSGMLGGMPVAVAAGLCWPEWREGAGQHVPLPTSRIVMVDVRNLDEAEETLIRSTDVEIVRFGEGFDVAPVLEGIARLATKCDQIYVHVDADILDASLQPNHPTVERGGPGVEPVVQVLKAAFETGKVCAFAVVSVNPNGPEGRTSVESAGELLVRGARAWDAVRAAEPTWVMRSE